MFTVVGLCDCSLSAPPKGNFGEPFEIKVPENFTEREIIFDENGMNVKIMILYIIFGILSTGAVFWTET